MHYSVRDLTTDEEHEFKNIPAVLKFINENRSDKGRRNVGAKKFKTIMSGNGVFDNQFKITKITGRRGHKNAVKPVELTPPPTLPSAPMAEKPLPFRTKKDQRKTKNRKPMKTSTQAEDTVLAAKQSATAPIEKLTTGTVDPEGLKSNPTLKPQDKKKRTITPQHARKLKIGRAAAKFRAFLNRRMEAKGAFNLDLVKANVQAMQRELKNMSSQDIVRLLIRVAGDMNTSVYGVMQRVAGSVSHPSQRSQNAVPILDESEETKGETAEETKSDPPAVQTPRKNLSKELMAELLTRFTPMPDLEGETPKANNEGRVEIEKVMEGLVSAVSETGLTSADLQGSPGRIKVNENRGKKILTEAERANLSNMLKKKAEKAESRGVEEMKSDDPEGTQTPAADTMQTDPDTTEEEPMVEGDDEEDLPAEEIEENVQELPNRPAAEQVKNLIEALQNEKKVRETLRETQPETEERRPLPPSLLAGIQEATRNLKKVEETGSPSAKMAAGTLRAALLKGRSELTPVADRPPPQRELQTTRSPLQAAAEATRQAVAPVDDDLDLDTGGFDEETDLKPTDVMDAVFDKLVAKKILNASQRAQIGNQEYTRMVNNATDRIFIFTGLENFDFLTKRTAGAIRNLLRKNSDTQEILTKQVYENMTTFKDSDVIGRGPEDMEMETDENPTQGNVMEVTGDATENELDPELMPEKAHELTSYNISQLGENTPEDYYLLRTRLGTPMELTGYAPMVREFALNMLVKPHAKAKVANMLTEVAASNENESSLYVKYLNHLLFFMLKNIMKLPKDELGEVENDIASKYADFFGNQGEVEDNAITSHIRMVVNEGLQKDISIEPEIQDQLMHGAGALDFLKDWEKGLSTITRSTDGQEIEKEIVALQRMSRTHRRGHVLFDTGGSNKVRQSRLGPFKTPIDPDLRRPELDYKAPVSYTRRTPRIAVRRVGGPKRVQVPVGTMVSVGDQRKPLEIPAEHPDGRPWASAKEKEDWYRNKAASLDLEKSKMGQKFNNYRELANAAKALAKRTMRGSGATQMAGLRRRRGITLYADEGPERQAHKRLRKAFTLSMYDEI